jgi:hypothetical protein
VNDFELRTLYNELVGARAGAGRASCVAPESLMRLAAGDATEAERLTWLEHVAGCTDCRAELALAQSVAEAGTAVSRRRRTPWLALAASVVLLAGAALVWQRSHSGDDVVRGDGDAITLASPAGAVARDQATRFVWRALPGAAQYEVEVIAAAGDLVFATTTADTTIDLAGRVQLAAATEYRWRVTTALPDGRRLSSVAQGFRIREP